MENARPGRVLCEHKCGRMRKEEWERRGRHARTRSRFYRRGAPQIGCCKKTSPLQHLCGMDRGGLRFLPQVALYLRVFFFFFDV